jgi:large subunit ribosomal protein L20
MRVRRGVAGRRRHDKYRDMAKGFRGRRGSCLKFQKDAVEKSLQHAYAGRKMRKRDFRSLWIIRINAAVREAGLSYSKFIAGLNKLGIQLNRKSLSELAVNDKAAFSNIVEQVKAA